MYWTKRLLRRLAFILWFGQVKETKRTVRTMDYLNAEKQLCTVKFWRDAMDYIQPCMNEMIDNLMTADAQNNKQKLYSGMRTCSTQVITKSSRYNLSYLHFWKKNAYAPTEQKDLVTLFYHRLLCIDYCWAKCSLQLRPNSPQNNSDQASKILCLSHVGL